MSSSCSVNPGSVVPGSSLSLRLGLCGTLAAAPKLGLCDTVPLLRISLTMDKLLVLWDTMPLSLLISALDSSSGDRRPTLSIRCWSISPVSLFAAVLCLVKWRSHVCKAADGSSGGSKQVNAKQRRIHPRKANINWTIDKQRRKCVYSFVYLKCLLGKLLGCHKMYSFYIVCNKNNEIRWFVSIVNCNRVDKVTPSNLN